MPQWDLADRMRKALREADLGVTEMADFLGVARNTVSTWINGRIHPSVQTLRLWAMRTGVSYEWLAGEACARGLRRGRVAIPTAPLRIRKPGRCTPPRAVFEVAA